MWITIKTTESPNTHGNRTTLCSDNLVREKKKGFLEFNGHEGTAFPDLLDNIIAVLRGKFIALSAFIKKLERYYTNNLTAHPKVLEQKKQTHRRGGNWPGNSQTHGWNQLIRTKEQYKESTKPRADSLRKSTR